MSRLLAYVIFFLFITTFFMTACTASLPPGNILGPSTYYHRIDLKTGGFQRSYRVHVPPGYSGTTKMPLMVLIHGAFDTNEGIEKFPSFSKLADRENLVVLYPEGIGILGYLQHWNAGHCFGKAADDQIDDLVYLASAIEDVCMRLAIDRQCIYMVGFSNGGMMTYRLAAEHAGMLAAAAPTTASIGGQPNTDAHIWSIPRPKTPLPIFIVHGLDDDDIPFDGGRSMHRKGERSYFSVADSVQFWVETNECIGNPIDSHTSGGAIQIRSWNTCMKATVAVLCKIEGWGHTWPGPYFTAKLPPDDPFFNFDAAEIIWNFFKQFP